MALTFALLGNQLFLPRDGLGIVRLYSLPLFVHREAGGALLYTGQQIALLIALFLASGRLLFLPLVGRPGAGLLIFRSGLGLTGTLILRRTVALGAGAARQGRPKPVRNFACFTSLRRSLAVVRDTSLVHPLIDLGRDRRDGRH